MSRYRGLEALAFVFVVVSGSGCANGFVAGGPSWDAGTVAVTGVESGVGVQVEAGGFKHDGGAGVGYALMAGLLGFYGEADGDPILVTSADIRYRNYFDRSKKDSPIFYTVGGGPGAVFGAALEQLMLSVMAEVGVEFPAGPMKMSFSLRERPAVLVTEQAEFVNSLGLVLTLSFGDSGRTGEDRPGK